MMTNPKVWLAISSATMLACLAIIILIRPVFGIDFLGGSLLEFAAGNSDPAAITHTISDTLGFSATTQTTSAGSVIIRTAPLTPDQHEKVRTALQTANLVGEERRFESIGPTIGADLARKAYLAVALAIVAMVIYLSYEFRHTAGLVSSWKYGVAATIALVHDILVVTAAFAILGRTHNAPIDTLFLTAILAIMGYSVNDTIVLFNQLKVEWLATRTHSLLTTIDKAIRVTLIRSLNTSLTILLVLITLFLFGGETIRWFVVALLIGTISGAYSTIFVAPPWLYQLAKK